MGDNRFEPPYARLLAARDRASALHALTDEEVVEALAAASRHSDPLLANVLATEALNRIRRLRASLAHLGDGVVTLDAQGNVLWANPTAERLLGWRREEMLGRPWEEVARPDAAEGTFRRRNGEAICVQSTRAPILGAEGEPEGSVVAFTDVTERVRAERALAISEQRFRCLFHHSPDPVVTLEPDGTITDANIAAVNLTGVPLEISRGRKLQDFLDPADVERVIRLFRVVQKGQPQRALLRVLRPDGTTTLAEAMGIPIVVGKEVVGIHGVVRHLPSGDGA